MPNQRKKGKKFVGAWLPEKLYAELQRVARKRGVPASTIVDQLLTAHVISSATDPAKLADAIVSGAISEVSAVPAPGPVSYRSKRKAARRSKDQPAPGSPKKAPQP